jgi:spermidine synthase
VTARRAALLALFFASGCTALVYEVLWLRALCLVFGNTAHAAAAILAVFFLGLAAGQAVFGRRAPRLADPVRTYALLEAAVAVTASAYFALLPLYRSIYPSLFAALGDRPLPFAFAKLALSAPLLLPPAFCMGATLPVMGQVLVRRIDDLGRTFSLLYGANTLGGVAGAFGAAFVLPALFGYRASYGLTIVSSLAIAVLAYRMGTRSPAAGGTAALPAGAADRRPAGATPAGGVLLPALALGSGAATLALEVLWTRMFAQVLHNSVYSFSAILVTFLLSLALGAALAGALSGRRPKRPLVALFVLLLAAGIAVGATPLVFDWWTGHLGSLAGDRAWSGYVAAIFTAAAAVFLVPGVLIGSVFPYLLELRKTAAASAGAAIGALGSANTAGSVAGSLAAGFLLLPALGLWGSIRAVALLYLAGAFAVALREERLAVALRAAPLVAGLLLFAVVDAPRSARPGSEMARLESAFGIVSVVERDGIRGMWLDGHYSLGANGAIPNDWRQADLPLFLHPRPQSVFFLGMGTGITAGAGLLHPVERVTTVELIPDVVAAARRHFAPYTGGLFTDPRSRIVVADGRSYLQATAERYDVIVADLFVPWHAGAGSLYTREHFAAVRDRLTEWGVFAQWLPLYQLSRAEFAIITRTMLEVFPQVTLWRGDFSPAAPIVALIGHVAPVPLDLEELTANVRRRLGREDFPAVDAQALVLLFYAGNPSQAHALFDAEPLNSDDRPAIEWTAPVTQRRAAVGAATWLTSFELLGLYAQLAAAVPLDDDTFLLQLNGRERGYAGAGRALYEARVYEAGGGPEEARRSLREFARRVPESVARMFARP